MDQPGEQHPNVDAITQAEKFMDSNTTDQKAIFDEMSSVTDIEKILPENLSTWDKATTSLILEKTLGLCGISVSTEEETLGEVTTLQETVEKQIEALKQKMEKNAKALEKHHSIIAQRIELRARIDSLRENLNRYVHDQNIAEFMESLQESQNVLDSIKLPLIIDQAESRKREAEVQGSEDVVPSKKYTGSQDQEASNDVVFLVEGKKFNVSKEKLIKNCDYFEPMLNGAFMESNMAEIPLEKRTAADFELFLKLLDQENCLTENNIFNAVEVARFYQAKGIMDTCEKWLKADSNIDKNEKFQLADHYDLESLKKIILNTIPTVIGIKEILPEKFHDWTKNTLSVVLEKTWEYFGIRKTTEQRTVRAVEREQNTLQMQIDALVLKKEELAALATRQRE